MKLGQRRPRAAGQEESQGWRSKWCCLMSSTGAAVQYPSMGLLGCCHAWSSCICGNRHTTLHARRLQAPPDESEADSGDDSGDEPRRPAPTVVKKPPEAAMRLGMGCSREGGEQRWQGAGEQAAGNGAGSKAHGCSYKNTASRRTAKRRKLHRALLATLAALLPAAAQSGVGEQPVIERRGPAPSGCSASRFSREIISCEILMAQIFSFASSKKDPRGSSL